MKKQIIAVLILACLAAFAGCRGNDAAVPESGTYRMEAPEDKASFAPELILDQKGQSFYFYYDFLSSLGSSGTYQIEEGQLIASVTYDGRQFVFQIVDSKTLAFVEDQSAQTSLQDERFGVALYDGARFVLVEEEAAP